MWRGRLTLKKNYLQLFLALGVKGLSIKDIDTAHRVSSMKPSNRPNAIAYKFVRGPAEDQVMAARKNVSGVKAEDLGFAADIDVKYLNTKFKELSEC